MADIIYKEESYKIVGACFEVHKQLGPGFLESVYTEALESEFQKIDIPYEKEKKLQIFYSDQLMKKYFKADFICYDKIILEIKATDMLIKAHVQQITNNVRATNLRLGLLINFGSPSLTYKRIINSHNS
jgi:GxxExxY protein